MKEWAQALLLVLAGGVLVIAIPIAGAALGGVLSMAVTGALIVGIILVVRELIKNEVRAEDDPGTDNQ